MLDDYQSASADFGDWKRLEQIVHVDRFRRSVTHAELAGYAIIVAMRERTPFPVQSFEELPELKLLITTGSRNAAIDLGAAAARGIVVCGTRSSSGNAAEHCWALLLALMRRLPDEIANFRSAGSQWQVSVGRELRGRTLGVAGLGRLGSIVARYGVAFGMDVAGWSRSNSPEISAQLGIRYAPTLNELLEQSDVLTLHLPATAETARMIDGDALARMKRGAVLVNTSRGQTRRRRRADRSPAVRAPWRSRAGRLLAGAAAAGAPVSLPAERGGDAAYGIRDGRELQDLL
jgi:phosphoglycerate dehydrogenase-like enzyme